MAVVVAALIAVLRWGMLAGLAGALGGLAGRGLARQYKGAAPAPLPTPWALRSALLGAAATAAATGVVFAARALLTLSAHPAVAALVTTGQGKLIAAECVAFLLAAAALRLRQPGLSVLPLLGVIVVEAIRAHPEGIVPVGGALLTICHVLPAVMWAGMLLYTLRAAVAWRRDPVAMRGLIRLYANAAFWLFAVVVITGVVTVLVLVPLHDLFSTAYGIVVIVKAALVSTVAGLAIGGRAWLGHDPAAPGGPPRVTFRECGVLAGVLAITAVLTVLTPPAAHTADVGTRTARAQSGPSGASSPSSATTTRMPRGGRAGQGV
jgi:copper transport protein